MCVFLRMSVTTAGSVPSPNSAIMASVDMTNDPIAKAVMENVLGRLPTKKPKVSIYTVHQSIWTIQCYI